MSTLVPCSRRAAVVLLTTLAGAAAPAADTTPHPVALGVVGDAIAGEVDCSHHPSGEPGVPLYTSVGGAIGARLVWGGGGVEGCTAFLVRGGQRTWLGELPDTRELSYESLSLVYYGTRAGHALVFVIAEPPGYWVRIKDLPGARLQRWPEVLAASDRFGYQDYDGVELRAQPSDAAAVLVKLRERGSSDNPVHQVLPTGELSGNWGKFEVIEFNGDFSPMAEDPDARPTGRKWTGWIHLLKPNGEPRFWFFPRD